MVGAQKVKEVTYSGEIKNVEVTLTGQEQKVTLPRKSTEEIQETQRAEQGEEAEGTLTLTRQEEKEEEEERLIAFSFLVFVIIILVL